MTEPTREPIDNPFPEPTPPSTQRAYLSAIWWRILLDKATRNGIQTVIPVLVSATAGSIDGYEPVSILIGIAAAVLITVLKALAQLATGAYAREDSPFVLQLADRAIPAAAATLLTFVTVDGASLASSVDWQAAWIATASAALLAVAQRVVSPPARPDNLTLAA